MTRSRVCILAAGRGTRINTFSGHLHKALLPFGRHAVLTQIIGQFPTDTRYVIALGHKADQVREYVRFAHPDLDVAFVDVDPFEGPGSGPGRSLWACRSLLDAPFVLTACDSICTAPVPPPSFDWMGVHPVEDPEHWCTLVVGEDGSVRALRYKDQHGTNTAFVGVAGIATWDVFFDGLAASLAGTGEVQVDAGFEALVAHGRCATVDLGWLDTGTDATYRAARLALGIDRDLTFAGKETDVTFHVGPRVVKVFFEPGRARRVASRLDTAGEAAPQVSGAGDLVLAYEYVDGSMFDESVDERNVRHFLTWAEASLWRPQSPTSDFGEACTRFYIQKTRDRLSAYLALTTDLAEIDALTINGRITATVSQHLDTLAADDAFTSGGLASTFHGDLHGGNIVRVADSYRLIDWREDFGGITTAGDRYYDLAKFLHTLELTVAVMQRDSFVITKNGSAFLLALPDDRDLTAARRAFWNWSTGRYDPWRIAVIDALIFVNMAPLYAEPLRDLLYLLGRVLLDAALDRETDGAQVFDAVMKNDQDGRTA